MAKQKHDIGYQKSLKRELFAKARPRRTKRRSRAIPAETVELLQLHSIQGVDQIHNHDDDYTEWDWQL